MTITIRDLTDELAQTYADATVEGVEVYVDQLIGIDGEDAAVAQRVPIKNGSGRTIGTEVYLTDEAADAVRTAYAVAAETREDELILAEIAEVTRQARDLHGKRDRLIRVAVLSGVAVPAIAARSGLSVPRIYQIRDGRY